MTSVLESLNNGLKEALTEDDSVILLGEDILDPYGGAFKVTRNLSESFPDRVITTPISEAGIVGLAGGMALRGLRPVVEIMFGDFLALATDSLINHASKFRWMYNEQVQVPLVVRTPMGGRRGYGPTHSQTLEKHFLGVPGLRTIAACGLGNPGRLLESCILEGVEPTLFIENKLLYLLQTQEINSDREFIISEIPFGKQDQDLINAPTYRLALRGAPPATITLATYGYPAEIARQAALQLAYEAEVFIEILVCTQLAPFELSPIFESISRTRRLVTLEEGAHDLGWGAEVLSQVVENFETQLIAAKRITALQLPIPSSGPLEEKIFPNTENVVELCKNIALKR